MAREDRLATLARMRMTMMMTPSRETKQVWKDRTSVYTGVPNMDLVLL